MRFEKKNFNSKISRRVFATFITCSLLPILCLAILVYVQIILYLEDQVSNNLRQAAKSQAMNIDDRLKVLEKDLAIISSTTKIHSLSKPQTIDARLRDRLLKRFNSIALVVNPDQPLPIINQSEIPSLQLAPDDVQHISAGNTLLAEIKSQHSKVSLWMVRLVDVNVPAKGIMVGEINLDYLWTIDNLDNLPIDTDICILDSSHRPLISSKTHLNEITGVLKANTETSTSGSFE